MCKTEEILTISYQEGSFDDLTPGKHTTSKGRRTDVDAINVRRTSFRRHMPARTDQLTEASDYSTRIYHVWETKVKPVYLFIMPFYWYILQYLKMVKQRWDKTFSHMSSLPVASETHQ